jgi:hypothetical protein
MVTDRTAAPEMDKIFRAFVDKATGVKATPLTKTAGAK